MSLPGDQIAKKVVPRTHERIEIKTALVTFLAGNQKKFLPRARDVKSYIQKLLDESLEIIIDEVDEWINRFAPMLTGDLRESLVIFLNKSRPPPVTAGELRGIRLVMGAGGDVKYARYVNEMTTAQVRHPIDPQAVGRYHDKMVRYGKSRFHINLDKAMYKFNGG